MFHQKVVTTSKILTEIRIKLPKIKNQIQLNQNYMNTNKKIKKKYLKVLIEEIFGEKSY